MMKNKRFKTTLIALACLVAGGVMEFNTAYFTAICLVSGAYVGGQSATDYKKGGGNRE